MMKFYQPLVGTIDGTNVVFITADLFVSNTVRYFLNGVEYKPVTDYVENVPMKQITLLSVVPLVGDEHWVHFQVS